MKKQYYAVLDLKDASGFTYSDKDGAGIMLPQEYVWTKYLLRPCPTPGLIWLLRSHRSSTAQLRSHITYSGHGRADIPPLSTTLV